MINRTRRWLIPLLIVGYALVTAWQAYFTWVQPNLPMVDLSVYRSGGYKLLHGTALYGGKFEGVSLPFTYPPFAAVLFAPFALIGAWGGSLVITAISTTALARVCWLLIAARLPEQSVSARWQSVTLLWAVALRAEPVTATLSFGQINLLILWLVLEDLLGGQRRGRGLLIGLAAGLKLTPGLFLVMLAVCGRRIDALRAVGALAATVVVGLAVQPSEGWLYWTKLAYDDRRVGGVAYVANQSLNGVIWRLTGPGGVRWVWALSAMLVAAVALVSARRFWQVQQQLSAIAVTSLGMLLVSPISWSHHWVWVVPISVALTQLPFRRVSLALLGSGFVVFYSRGIFRVPSTHDVEYHHNLLQQFVGNSYALWALAALAIFVAAATTTATTTAPPPPNPQEGTPAVALSSSGSPPERQIG